MKTSTEHNDEVIQARKDWQEKTNLSGFACPKCGKELEYTNPNILLLSNPPCKRAKCSECGFEDYITQSSILKSFL